MTHIYNAAKAGMMNGGLNIASDTIEMSLWMGGAGTEYDPTDRVIGDYAAGGGVEGSWVGYARQIMVFDSITIDPLIPQAEANFFAPVFQTEEGADQPAFAILSRFDASVAGNRIIISHHNVQPVPNPQTGGTFIVRGQNSNPGRFIEIVDFRTPLP